MQASDLAGTADDAGRTLFCAVPRPEDAVWHPQWRTALRRIEAALGQPGVVAILGPPGTGKTLLLHAVAQRLRAAGWAPVLLQQGLAPDMREPDVVLIDRPDLLPAAMLDALAQQRRPVVLTGPLDMADRLTTARVPVTVATLAPLAPDDAAMFLDTQLAQADQSADLLHPDAVQRLIERSGGVPRTLQMLAGLSVFMARLGDADQVTAAHVERAALVQHGTDLDDDEDGDEPLDGPARPDAAASVLIEKLAAAPVGHPARSWAPAAAALGILCCALTGGWFLLARDRPRDTPLASTAPSLAPTAQPALTSPAIPPTQPARTAGSGAVPQPRPLPPAVPVHVSVSYPTGDVAAGTYAAGVAGKLRTLGYQVAPPEPGGARGEAAVLYAFAEDEPTAAALARALGVGATQIRPAAMPRPGAVRVLVPPTGAAPPRRTPAPLSQAGTTR